MTSPAAPRNIRVVADAASLSAWLPALCKRLAADGAAVSLDLREGGSRLSALDTLLSLEAMLLRRGRPCWCDRIGMADVAQWTAGGHAAEDLTIDLTAAGITATTPILRPLFDGASGEEALASALFFRGTPRIDILSVMPSGEARIVASGTAALEVSGGIGGAMEAVWSRTILLLQKAIADPQQKTAGKAAEPLPVIRNADVLRHGAKAVASAAARAAYHLCCHAPHWRIGWRFVDDGYDVWSRRDLGGTRWSVLADPVDHFYADPVPWRHQGRDYLLFEDLDHRTNKGIISAVAFDEAGRPGPVVPVLEEPWHMSYPFLIEADGAVWMIPEASLSGAIAIYRAVDFPWRWERHATLVSGVEAADATVVAHEGRFYMFAVVRDGIGGYSDTLAIWHAPNLFGPWQPHAGNPVMVDDRAARPAGNFVEMDGALWRPVQDCRGGYGAALGLARIDRLDPENFAQTVEKTLHPGGEVWPGRRLHTLNRAGRLEVIDGSIIRPRWKPLADIVDRRYQPR